MTRKDQAAKKDSLGRFIKGVVIMGSCAALFGCGASAPTGQRQPDAPAVGSVAAGTFIDAPIAGLSYQSGSESGTTDDSGKFTYIVGSQVTFKVGGIVLGSAVGDAVITPINLAGAGSSAATPKVVALVQFLKTISSEDAGTGNLSIPASVLDAAAGKKIDFNSPTASMQVADVTAQIAVGNPLISPAAAQDHMNNSLHKLVAGIYSGTWTAPASNPSSGTFTITVAGNGSMVGTAMLGNTRINVTSTMTSKLVSGSAYAVNGTVNNGAVWNGTLDVATRTLTGSALYDGVNATFTASR